MWATQWVCGTFLSAFFERKTTLKFGTRHHSLHCNRTNTRGYSDRIMPVFLICEGANTTGVPAETRTRSFEIRVKLLGWEETDAMPTKSVNHPPIQICSIISYSRQHNKIRNLTLVNLLFPFCGPVCTNIATEREQSLPNNKKKWHPYAG